MYYVLHTEIVVESTSQLKVHDIEFPQAALRITYRSVVTCKKGSSCMAGTSNTGAPGSQARLKRPI